MSSARIEPGSLNVTAFGLPCNGTWCFTNTNGIICRDQIIKLLISTFILWCWAVGCVNKNIIASISIFWSVWQRWHVNHSKTGSIKVILRSLKGQKVFDLKTHRQPHSLTTCFVSHAILHDEIEYFGKKSWGFGGFSGLQFPQGGGKKVTRCSWVDTRVWRPGEIPNPKNITNWHLVGENYDSPSSWMKGGSSWEWIWILRPASYEISSKNSINDPTWPL